MPNVRRNFSKTFSFSVAAMAMLTVGCGGGGGGGSSSGGPPPPPPAYIVASLGTLGPVAINNNGQVLGAVGLTSQIWQGQSSSSVGSGPSTPLGINDTGAVVGSVANPVIADAQIAASLSSGHTSILSIPDSNPSRANGINASGAIVGVYTAGFTSGPFHNQAFEYVDGALTDLPTLSGSVGATAVDINDSGLIAGFGDVPNDHAILWRGAVPQDLGVLGGTTSVATAINNPGMVVGYSDTSTAGIRHAFVWKAGAMTDLGTLKTGQSSRALAINNNGIIAGFSGAAFVDQKAVIWKNGKVVDLNTLISNGGQWSLEVATGINDAGVIVGTGTLNGNPANFILTPNPAA